MTTQDQQTSADATPEQLETLYAQACTRLLEATEFGRLAVVDGGKPRMVVLNHVVDGPHVLFRTREDAYLARRTEDGHVIDAVYEVDSALPVGRSGWSVIATGHLSREFDPDSRDRAFDKLTPWAEGDRDVVLRLTVTELSGRRVGRI